MLNMHSIPIDFLLTPLNGPKQLPDAVPEKPEIAHKPVRNVIGS